MRKIPSTRAKWTVACCAVALGLFSTAVATAAEPPSNNTVYQVFVRSFRDEGGGNGIGDLRGLTVKLNYVNDGDPATDNDLEAGIVWLMPIFPSPDYHGYSVDDYRAIDSEYGTLADFDALIQAAHQRGIRVILDLPLNHTSNRHQWFQNAVNDPDGPFGKFYHLSVNDRPTGDDWHWVDRNGKRVYYFGDFGMNMPDLNLGEAEVRQAVKDASKFWLDRGVDGFRLDAAKHIFGWAGEPNWEDIKRSNAWWKEYSGFVQTTKPGAILVGEVLASEEVIHHFAYGLDGLVDPNFMHRVRDFAAKRNGGVVDWWRGTLQYCRENNSKFDLFPFVASHDENPRLASYLRENAGADKAEGAYRLAMSLLLTVGKYAIIYNGDEVMQPGYKWNGSPAPGGDGSGFFDETLREPFPWYRTGTGAGQTTWFNSRFDTANDGISVEEQESATSILSLVRALTNLRAKLPLYANGEIRRILNDNNGWIVFEKGTDQEAYLILVNASEAGQDYRFHDQWYPEYRNARLMFWSDGRQKRWKETIGDNLQINGSVFVPPTGLVVLKRP